MENIIDISPIIGEDTAVFPGDTFFSRNELMSFAAGDHLALSSFETTPHIGAHADAPSHYSAQGVGIDRCSLKAYLGSCQVVTLNLKANERILLTHFDLEKIRTPRVLFKTCSFNDPNTWHNTFNSLSPEVIEALAKRGVVLVGIDTPSVDPADSKDLESHAALFKWKMANLEGLILEDVDEGVYTLCALPLKIKNGDASPVRAVLIRNVQNLD